MEKLIPNLRFPYFEGEWELKKIGEITEKVNSGKTPLGGESVYVEKGVLFIRSQNILNSKLSFENSTFITETINNTMKNSVVKSNDILLNITGASLGRSCVVPNDFTIGNVNQHVCIIRLNKDNTPYFLQPIFSSEKGQNIFTSLQTGSGREGLNFQSIRGMTLAFPSFPEQQKIASFLSAVDEKIQQLNRKKELLEQYKKGVMQQLFSGKLRFKDENGEEFANWEEKRLGDILELQHGYQFRTSDFTIEGLAIIKISNVIGNNLYLQDLSFINPNRLKEFSRFEIYKGDILMSLTGNIGRVIEVKSVPFKMIQNYRVGKFVPYDSNYLSKKFTKHLLMSDVVFGRFGQLSNQSAQANFGKQDMDKIHVLIPLLSEQLKIANFLSNIDSKIESTNQQIYHTQTFKKGLLQKMFV